MYCQVKDREKIFASRVYKGLQFKNEVSKSLSFLIMEDTPVANKYI
jgi:hypothetical protein